MHRMAMHKLSGGLGVRSGCSSHLEEDCSSGPLSKARRLRVKEPSPNKPYTPQNIFRSGHHVCGSLPETVKILHVIIGMLKRTMMTT